MRKEVDHFLTEATKDSSLRERFRRLWPMIESMLQAFSRALDLPIFVFANGHCLFQSAKDTLPPFCAAMLADGATGEMCYEDGRRRAESAEADIEGGWQLCHAGLVNGRREISVSPIGQIVILYGSRKQSSDESVNRRQSLIEKVNKTAPERAARLRRASSKMAEVGSREGIAIQERDLIDAISLAIEDMFKVSVGFHWLAINMAHELSKVLLGTGMMIREFEDELQEVAGLEKVVFDAERFLSENRPILIESQLGVYLIRNFLSHVSESRYSDAVSQKYSTVDLEEMIREMVLIYSHLAQEKEVVIAVDDTLEVPKVHGIDVELRRALHNILTNAVKYSYHSIPEQVRKIRIFSKVPYDPGFRRRRFALVVENYGLGVTAEEERNVFKSGFRGEQAQAEVPIGSGIGLSETKKIVEAHGGEIKLRSKEVHRDQEGEVTYLTQVELIFPY